METKNGRELLSMKNYYSTVNDIVCTFSDIEEEHGFDEITIRFERQNETGFDFAEGKLPENVFYKCFGFSEDELMKLEKYMKNNSALIWKIAQEEGGKTVA